MDFRRIIYDYLTDGNDYNLGNGNEFACLALKSLMRWLSEDDVVDWFVGGYCARDDEAVIDALGEEDGKAVLEYYDLHCNK